MYLRRSRCTFVMSASFKIQPQPDNAFNPFHHRNVWWSDLATHSPKGPAAMDRFLKKTFDAFSNPNHSSCCGWGPNGDTIVVHNVSLTPVNFVVISYAHSTRAHHIREDYSRKKCYQSISSTATTCPSSIN